MNTNEIKTTSVNLDLDSYEKLAALAKLDRRDRSATVCVLIQDEWARRQITEPVTTSAPA